MIIYSPRLTENKCFSVLLKTDTNKKQAPSKLDAKLADINFEREISNHTF